MNILSLFDGMSCGQIALKQLGIIPEVYYASEIDKHAIKQTQLNFPNTIQLGDVTRVDVSQLETVDLLIGGSPCQSFSFAGKRVGMSTTDKEEIYTLDRYLELKEEGFQFEGESYLFWEYMRILTDIRKYNPNVLFLLENVEMGKKWERVLSEAIGVYGVHINSALVSAQNRKRIYWTNIRTRRNGLFGELHSDIPQPEDRGILLRDVLEDKVDEKYNVSQSVINRMNRKTYSSPAVNPEKTGTLNTRNNSGQMSLDSGTTFVSDGFVLDRGNIRLLESQKSTCIDAHYHQFPDNHGQRTGIISQSRQEFIKVDINGNPKANQNKASCFTGGAHSGGNHSDMDLICVAMRGRNPDNPSDRRAGSPTEQRLEPNTSGKTNCLTSVQKDNLILQRSRGNNTGGIFDGKTPTMSACAWEQNNLLSQGKVLRRLTPTECARLQTIPNWYKWECSDTQQYRMLGNGWTVDVIVHILSFMKEKLNINVARKGSKQDSNE
ncbi:DNA cytosine methyltransferase [Bacteroides thetaiotaomicron]|uniref:DNA cytosine methyltransferase n=1 Tax=Bacteroides thetaiotaomicron TaxID=818 RepID=UPI002222B0FA|nr:DNA cytosine methyltransferase [Bacteroides thetaiotaomicron]UYU94541.1 DNA cytosine methyltransferase [Bacteroides thetaiotaomicron]